MVNNTLAPEKGACQHSGFPPGYCMPLLSSPSGYDTAENIRGLQSPVINAKIVVPNGFDSLAGDMADAMNHGSTFLLGKEKDNVA